MKPLLEESNRIEVDRIRMLCEKNGIPIYVGNEATARNLNFMLLTKNYSIAVCEDDQYNCALALLEDENYVVKAPRNVQNYYALTEENSTSNYRLFWLKIIFPGIFIIMIIVSLTAFLNSLR